MARFQIPQALVPATLGNNFIGTSVFSTATQSLANNTGVIINFDTETFDTDGFHDNTTNNSRITVPSGRAGYYCLIGSVNYASNATGVRYVSFFKNGVNIGPITRVSAISGAQMWVSCSAIVYGAVNDYFQIEGFQNSGGNLNSGGSYFQAFYIGA